METLNYLHERMTWKAKLWIATVLFFFVAAAALGTVNTFANTINTQELCEARIIGQAAVRDGFLETQKNLVRFAGASVVSDYGIDSPQYHKFNHHASDYMITVRADLIRSFPQPVC